MPSAAELLHSTELRLEQAGVPEPRRQAASLLAFAIEQDKTFLIAHPEYELTETENDSFRKLVERRASREPFQYITGVQEFYGLDFIVTPDVLIPRPETELLIEKAVEFLGGRGETVFCEVGVGSGCISIAILKNVAGARAVALDLSDAALKIAEKNARNHRVDDRLELRRSNVFGALENEKFDLIVSNPPYIAAAEMPFLQPEVRDFEPHAALTDDGDGLSIIGRIIAASPSFLMPGGALLLEIGLGQVDHVREMLFAGGWTHIRTYDDLQGIPRCAFARTGISRLV